MLYAFGDELLMHSDEMGDTAHEKPHRPRTECAEVRLPFGFFDAG